MHDAMYNTVLVGMHDAMYNTVLTLYFAVAAAAGGTLSKRVTLSPASLLHNDLSRML